MNKLLDSLHEKILRSDFAKEVTEAEINALIEAKNDDWILCSDNLPEAGAAMRVWLSYTNPVTSFVKRAWWSDDHFEWENGQEPKELPVAWKPYVSPAPYVQK